MKGIVWFRDDLRVEDNETLSTATRECTSILPVFIIDNSWFEEDRWRIKRCGPFRFKFLLESLKDLDHQLNEKNSRLLIISGDPVQKIFELAAKHDIQTIYASKSFAHDEVKQEEKIAAQLSLKLFYTSVLYHPKDIPFTRESIPDIFTEFRKGVEKKSHIRELYNAPERITTIDFQPEPFPKASDFDFDEFNPDPRSVIKFKGGTAAAWDRIDHYFWRTEELINYKFTRNGLIGEDYSSKLSPWLALGCISARQVYHEVKDFEQKVKKNVSTYWLVFELIWRDYFHFVFMKYGAKLFWKYGIKGREYFNKNRSLPMTENDKKFELWKEGRTGQSFIDANMKELNKTGFMSNRGRQNVASYLVHQLGVDWRMGASWFENRLIDYDPCSNYGNWTYVAGVGNDPRPARAFNAELQSEKYDEKGEYQNLWNL